LEELESRDVPSYLAAEFPGHGVWRYQSTSGTWTQLTAANASVAVADRIGDVVAEIPGQGVWLYPAFWQFGPAPGQPTLLSNWRQITPNNASILAIGLSKETDPSVLGEIDSISVAAEFPGFGVWRYELNLHNAAAGWQQLTTNNATTLTIDDARNVVAEFPGWGVWLAWGGTSSDWIQLNAADAVSLAISTFQEPNESTLGTTYVTAAFPSHGVWRARNNNFGEIGGIPGYWQQLTASDAATVGINQNGDVVGEFPGWGVWTYSDAGAGGYHPGWNQLTATDAALVGIDSSGNVYGQFPGWGVWYDRFAYWQSITPCYASSFGAGG
jgi:hypothetical protein